MPLQLWTSSNKRPNRLHTLSSVNGGQGLVVNVLWSAANVQITHTRASIVILHARRCVNCCAGMLWLMLLQALIHVLFKTSKKQAVIGLGRNANMAYLFWSYDSISAWRSIYIISCWPICFELMFYITFILDKLT